MIIYINTSLRYIFTRYRKSSDGFLLSCCTLNCKYIYFVVIKRGYMWIQFPQSNLVIYVIPVLVPMLTSRLTDET